MDHRADDLRQRRLHHALSADGIIGHAQARVADPDRMNSPVLATLARVLLAGLFVGLGAERLLGAAGIGPLAGTLLSNGTLVFSVLELVAGVLLAIGRQVRVLAVLLAAFLVVDAVLSHPFWRHAGSEAHMQWLHFLKNIAVVGGLLLLAASARGRR